MYRPEKVAESVKCPVFLRAGLRDHLTRWVERLSRCQRARVMLYALLVCDLH